MPSKRDLATLIGLLLCTTGCWDEQIAWYHATFSDDDQAVVLLRDDYEQRTYGRSGIIGSYPTRNHRHQLFIHDLRTGEQRRLGAQSLGPAPEQLHFMRSAGYVLATYFEYGEAPGIRVQQHWLDGRTVPILDHPFSRPDGPQCDLARVIPSPDGETLAIVREPPDCQAFRVDISLLDARSLAVVTQQELVFDGAPFEPQFHRSLAVTWSVEGTLEVDNLTTPGGAVSIALDGRTTPRGPVLCNDPPTNSSEYSDDGRRRVVAADGGIRMVAIEDHPMPFPCQEAVHGRP